MPTEKIGEKNTEAAISARLLSKRFNGVTAVDSLSFVVNEGEVLGLLGPNGSGKTTTIRMLAGLIAPTSGEASVCGYQVGRDDEAIRKNIGLLTEVPGLYESLSAKKNLEIYARLYGVPNVAAQVEKYLRLLDLWERRDEPAQTFSKGMKQKLAICRALVHEPRVLFLDEPTSGLDPQMTKIVRDFLETLHGQGRTILLSTHNLDEAERLCDRIAVIRSRLVALDRPDTLRFRLFGRHTIIRLRRATPEILGVARGLSFVKDLRVAGNDMIVALDDPQAQNPELVRHLVAAGADVLYVTEQEHSLEEIYLNLINEEKRA